MSGDQYLVHKPPPTQTKDGAAGGSSTSDPDQSQSTSKNINVNINADGDATTDQQQKADQTSSTTHQHPQPEKTKEEDASKKRREESMDTDPPRDPFHTPFERPKPPYSQWRPPSEPFNYPSGPDPQNPHHIQYHVPPRAKTQGNQIASASQKAKETISKIVDESQKNLQELGKHAQSVKQLAPGAEGEGLAKRIQEQVQIQSAQLDSLKRAGAQRLDTEGTTAVTRLANDEDMRLTHRMRGDADDDDMLDLTGGYDLRPDDDNSASKIRRQLTRHHPTNYLHYLPQEGHGGYEWDNLDLDPPETRYPHGRRPRDYEQEDAEPTMLNTHRPPPPPPGQGGQGISIAEVESSLRTILAEGMEEGGEGEETPTLPPPDTYATAVREAITEELNKMTITPPVTEMTEAQIAALAAQISSKMPTLHPTDAPPLAAGGSPALQAYENDVIRPIMADFVKLRESNQGTTAEFAAQLLKIQQLAKAMEEMKESTATRTSALFKEHDDVAERYGQQRYALDQERQQVQDTLATTRREQHEEKMKSLQAESQRHQSVADSLAKLHNIDFPKQIQGYTTAIEADVKKILKDISDWKAHKMSVTFSETSRKAMTDNLKLALDGMMEKAKLANDAHNTAISGLVEGINQGHAQAVESAKVSMGEQAYESFIERLTNPNTPPNQALLQSIKDGLSTSPLSVVIDDETAKKISSHLPVADIVEACRQQAMATFQRQVTIGDVVNLLNNAEIPNEKLMEVLATVAARLDYPLGTAKATPTEAMEPDDQQQIAQAAQEIKQQNPTPAALVAEINQKAPEVQPVMPMSTAAPAPPQTEPPQSGIQRVTIPKTRVSKSRKERERDTSNTRFNLIDVKMRGLAQKKAPGPWQAALRYMATYHEIPNPTRQEKREAARTIEEYVSDPTVQPAAKDSIMRSIQHIVNSLQVGYSKSKAPSRQDAAMVDEINRNAEKWDRGQQNLMNDMQMTQGKVQEMASTSINNTNPDMQARDIANLEEIVTDMTKIMETNEQQRETADEERATMKMMGHEKQNQITTGVKAQHRLTMDPLEGRETPERQIPPQGPAGQEDAPGIIPQPVKPKIRRAPYKVSGFIKPTLTYHDVNDTIQNLQKHTDWQKDPKLTAHASVAATSLQTSQRIHLMEQLEAASSYIEVMTNVLSQQQQGYTSPEGHPEAFQNYTQTRDHLVLISQEIQGYLNRTAPTNNDYKVLAQNIHESIALMDSPNAALLRDAFNPFFRVAEKIPNNSDQAPPLDPQFLSNISTVLSQTHTGHTMYGLPRFRPQGPEQVTIVEEAQQTAMNSLRSMESTVSASINELKEQDPKFRVTDLGHILQGVAMILITYEMETIGYYEQRLEAEIQQTRALLDKLQDPDEHRQQQSNILNSMNAHKDILDQHTEYMDEHGPNGPNAVKGSADRLRPKQAALHDRQNLDGDPHLATAGTNPYRADMGQLGVANDPMNQYYDANVTPAAPANQQRYANNPNEQSVLEPLDTDTDDPDL